VTRNTQAGFSLPHVLLLLLLIGIIGFTGWRVYDAQKKTSKTLDNAANSQNDVKAETKKPAAAMVVPEGFVEYKNQELGFQFAYPKEWGEAKTEKGPETPHLANGSEYKISFTSNSEVTAGVQSKDWKHREDLGHDGNPEDATSYVSPNLISDDSLGDKKFTAPEGVIYGTGIAGIGCSGAGYILQHVLNGNETYPYIAFLYFEKRQPEIVVDKDNPSAQPALDVCDTYHNYLTTEHLDQLKQIFKTITIL
jgi:hypothetical protein